MTFTIGICAYNEEKNIDNLLSFLITQGQMEIIVIASGCTDGTVPLAQKYYPRVKTVIQEKREGKASAVNLLIQEARGDIIILIGADTLPTEKVIGQIVDTFENPEVGMVGCRPLPTNNSKTFTGYACHLIWKAHHELNMINPENPKLGELTAFRKIFQRIDPNTLVDEAQMEPIIKAQGYKLKYLPNAVVHNRGPETIPDFIKQRKRIHKGHLLLGKKVGYIVASRDRLKSAMAILRATTWTPKGILYTLCTVILEIYARYLAGRDVMKDRVEAPQWEIIETTKLLSDDK